MSHVKKTKEALPPAYFFPDFNCLPVPPAELCALLHPSRRGSALNGRQSTLNWGFKVEGIGCRMWNVWPQRGTRRMSLLAVDVDGTAPAAAPPRLVERAIHTRHGPRNWHSSPPPQLVAVLMGRTAWQRVGIADGCRRMAQTAMMCAADSTS